MEHQMESTPNQTEFPPADEQFARLEEQLSTLVQRAAPDRSGHQLSDTDTFRSALNDNRSSISNWPMRGVAVSLFAACLGVVAWWWLSADTKSASFQKASATEIAAQDAAKTVQPSELAQQLQS